MEGGWRDGQRQGGWREDGGGEEREGGAGREERKEESFSCCTLEKKSKKKRESLLPPPQMLISSSSNFTPTLLLLFSSFGCCRLRPVGESLRQVSSLLLLLLFFCFFFSSSLCWDSELLRSVARPPSSPSCLSLFFPSLSQCAFSLSSSSSQWERRDGSFSPPPCSPWSCQSRRIHRAECKCSWETFSRKKAENQLKIWKTHQWLSDIRIIRSISRSINN